MANSRDSGPQERGAAKPKGASDFDCDEVALRSISGGRQSAWYSCTWTEGTKRNSLRELGIQAGSQVILLETRESSLKAIASAHHNFFETKSFQEEGARNHTERWVLARASSRYDNYLMTAKGSPASQWLDVAAAVAGV